MTLNPPVNPADFGDRYMLTTYLPGMLAEPLDLSIIGESLTLNGERTRPRNMSGEGYRRR